MSVFKIALVVRNTLVIKTVHVSAHNSVKVLKALLAASDRVTILKAA